MTSRNHLAPIGLAVYNRPDHLKKTVDALKANPLASSSDLYIFSDAAKTGDEELVLKVRKYLETISGFKSVTIFHRETNKIFSDNNPGLYFWIAGLNFLLERFGKMIMVEDDVITAPGFLEFMNEALDFYKDDSRVISIASHTPQGIIPDSYEKDYYSLPKYNAQAYALWGDKYFLIKDDVENLNTEQANENLNDLDFILKFCSTSINNYPVMLKNLEDANAHDLRITYNATLKNLSTIYPKKSLIQNIGHDGSGEHSSVTKKFELDFLWDKETNFVFSNDIKADDTIIKSHFNFWFSFNDFTKRYILDNLVEQIQNKKISSISGYGTGKLAPLFVEELTNILPNVEMNFFIESEPQKSVFLNRKVIKPEEAFILGERNFVILSIDFEKIMRLKLQAISKYLNIITPFTVCQAKDFREHCTQRLISNNKSVSVNTSN